MKYVFEAYRKYSEFNGRARRKEYWSFYALFLVVFFLAGLISDIGKTTDNIAVQISASAILAIFAIASIAPGLAVRVRRLHDTNRSGFWIFLAFLPVIGEAVLFIFALLPGTQGANRFGPDPKAVGSDIQEVFA